jgi:hypothetical protein
MISWCAVAPARREARAFDVASDGDIAIPSSPGRMKQGLAIGCVLVAAIGYASLAGSCLVDKRSNDFECSSQGQCGAGRICVSGHCVIDTTPPPDAPPLCPPQCQSCDFTGTPDRCTIVGDGTQAAICPTGFQCDITCATADACGPISCNNAVACTIACLAAGACDSVTCGNADCAITCATPGACQNLTCDQGRCDVECLGGPGACGNITCSNSCACDVACGAGAADRANCGTIACPRRTGQTFCTASSTDNEPCTSALTNCDDC